MKRLFCVISLLVPSVAWAVRIPSGTTDQYIYFVALDSTDYSTRETGLSSFTVYRSRDGAAAAAYTTPTINETDSSNMPGVYELLLDEDMTITAGNDSEEYVIHIMHAGMAPITRVIELYRREVTGGETLTVSSGAGVSTLAAGAITDASLAGNMEIVFETDFASNYNATRNAWVTNAQDFVGTTGADPFSGQVVAASVTGPVGSVTGNVGGNVTGSVGSISGVTFPTNFGDLSITVTTGRVDVASVAGTAQTANDNGADINAILVDTAAYDTDSERAAAIWGDALPGSYGVGEAGYIIGNVATLADMADGVWDEDIVAGHNTANTAGALLDSPADWATAVGFSTHSAADVRTEMDSNSTQLAAILADTGTDGVLLATGSVTAAVIATDAIDADAIATDAIDADAIASSAIGSLEIGSNAITEAKINDNAFTAAQFSADAWQEAADYTWDEDIVAAHDDADGAGYLLSMLTARAVTPAADVSLNSLFGWVMERGTSWDYDRDTDSLQGIAEGGASGLTKAQVREALFEDAYSLSANASDGSAMGQVLDADTDAAWDFVQADDSLQAISEGAASGDWSTAEKNQIRFRLALDGTQADPTTGTGTIEDILTDTNDLETRLTATRAGYLDELGPTNIPADLDNVLVDTAELQTNQGNWLTATGFATAANLATAQADLDILTGADGVTLAALQPNYTPNTVVPDAAGTAAGLHATTDGLITTVDGVVDAILVDTSAVDTTPEMRTFLTGSDTALSVVTTSDLADALTALGLDHLISASVSGTDIADDSIISVLMSKNSPADFDDFNNARHSLQAIGDKQ